MKTEDSKLMDNKRFKMDNVQVFVKKGEKYDYKYSLSCIKDTMYDNEYTFLDLPHLCDLLNYLDENVEISTGPLNEWVRKEQLEKRDEYWRGIETVYEKELQKLKDENEKLKKQVFLQDLEISEEKQSILNRFADYILDDDNIPGQPFVKRIKVLVDKFLEEEEC